jgi:hypothetical protein
MAKRNDGVRALAVSSLPGLLDVFSEERKSVRIPHDVTGLDDF